MITVPLILFMPMAALDISIIPYRQTLEKSITSSAATTSSSCDIYVQGSYLSTLLKLFRGDKIGGPKLASRHKDQADTQDQNFLTRKRFFQTMYE